MLIENKERPGKLSAYARDISIRQKYSDFPIPFNRILQSNIWLLVFLQSRSLYLEQLLFFPVLSLDEAQDGPNPLSSNSLDESSRSRSNHIFEIQLWSDSNSLAISDMSIQISFFFLAVK